jgi:hypothetical protein
VDTLVDPVEMLSSSSGLLAAKPAEPPPRPPRASLPSLDPDAQVQWFSRVFEEEPTTGIAVDVEVCWDDENDTEPTLVLRKRRH